MAYKKAIQNNCGHHVPLTMPLYGMFPVSLHIPNPHNFDLTMMLWHYFVCIYSKTSGGTIMSLGSMYS